MAKESHILVVNKVVVAGGGWWDGGGDWLQQKTLCLSVMWASRTGEFIETGSSPMIRVVV